MKPQIGVHADSDMRLYSFDRTSGLPAGYFDPPRVPWLHITIIATAFVIGGLACLLLA
jgi:hypothetical protein